MTASDNTVIWPHMPQGQGGTFVVWTRALIGDSLDFSLIIDTQIAIFTYDLPEILNKYCAVLAVTVSQCECQSLSLTLSLTLSLSV